MKRNVKSCNTKDECLSELRKELQIDGRKNGSKMILYDAVKSVWRGWIAEGYFNIDYFRQYDLCRNCIDDGKYYTFLDAINDFLGTEITENDIIDDTFYNQYSDNTRETIRASLSSLLLTYYIDTKKYQNAYIMLSKILKNHPKIADNFNMLRYSNESDPQVTVVNLIMGVAEFNTTHKEDDRKPVTRYFKTFAKGFYSLNIIEQDKLMENTFIKKMHLTALKMYPKINDALYVYNNSNFGMRQEDDIYIDLMETSPVFFKKCIDQWKYYGLWQGHSDRLKTIFTAYLRNKYLSSNVYVGLVSDIRDMIAVIEKNDLTFDIFDVIQDLPSKIQSAALEVQITG